MRKKTRMLLERAEHSLVFSIEVFNRPYENGRREAFLMLLDHAFEMLLKAAIFEKTGRIRPRRSTYSYGFEKFVSICLTSSRVKFLEPDSALTLKNVNAFRDAAAHDLLDISESLLYVHAQSSVTIFDNLSRAVFKRKLADVLPPRVLPVTASPPKDLTLIFDEEVTAIRGLLKGGVRKRELAEARLKALTIMEENVQDLTNASIRKQSLSTRARKLKAGVDWHSVLPLVAGLTMGELGALPVTIHLTKKAGIAVAIDQKAPISIALRYVDPEERYPFLTSELALKLNLTSSKVLSCIDYFQLKSKSDFHISLRGGKKTMFHRYSSRTLELIRKVVDSGGLSRIIQDQRSGKHGEPADFLE